MKTALHWLAAAALALCALPAQSEFHLFRIDQLYSNADGSVQFVVMHEPTGANGEHLWAGLPLRVTNSQGAAQQVLFPSNLPSSSTANRRVLIATPGFAALGIVAPDYSIPAGFLPINGGTLNYAGVDFVTYAALPTDGVNALTRSGAIVPNSATNFAGATGSVSAVPAIATAVEFYHAVLDHYFITHIAAEIAILDAGVTIKGWARTGQSFFVYRAAAIGTSPVCRYYIPPAKGDSHFYGRGTVECNATGQNNPSFINEDPQFFHLVLPAAGTCGAGTIPVYRVFSNRLDANHRYMIDRAIRDQMVSVQHWLAEGDGPDLVVMCAPGTASATPPPPPPTPTPPPPYEPPGYPGYPGYPP